MEAPFRMRAHPLYDNDNEKIKCYQNIRNTSFLVSDFSGKICKTWSMIKIIRSEIDLKINCSVKTPLHGYNRVAHSELWVPAFSEV